MKPVAGLMESLRSTKSPTALKFVDYMRLLQGQRSMVLMDYVEEPICRWGHGKPSHQGLADLISRNRQNYGDTIESFRATIGQLNSVNLLELPGSSKPQWQNNFFTGMDAVAMYNMPILKGTKTYFEIGSGNSTKWVNQSRLDHNLDLKIISVDPQPRAEIDTICDEVHRTTLQALDAPIFDQLEAGDILMIDSSHRCMPGSDVTILFLEVIPRLKKGVVVHVHDIMLPDDYPPEWARRHYSEQYLLAALLTYDQLNRYQPIFPCHFILQDPELCAAYNKVCAGSGPAGYYKSGASFWFEVC